MPKKKIAPEIQFPYFFKEELFAQAKINLYRKNTNELNSAIIRQQWFKDSPFYQDVIEKTNFCSKDASFSERFYCYINNIKEIPLSPISKKPLKWVISKGCYSIGANAKERAQLSASKEKIEKIKNTIKLKNKEVKSSFYNNYKNNNYKCYSLEELRALIKIQIEAKDYGRNGKWFGIEDYINNKDFLCSLLFYTKDFEQYIKPNDWSQRLYIIYYNYFDIIRQQLFSFNKYPTYLSFTAGFHLRDPEAFLNLRKKHKKIWADIIYKQGFDIIDDNYLESDKKAATLKCHKCGGIFSRRLDNGRYHEIYCYHCEKEGGVSRAEKQLREDIQSFYNGKIIFNDRKILNGKELDIYIPEKKLAIELNGVLWHSFGTTWPNNTELEKSEKQKHYNKYKECELLGIQLLQFTDIDYYSKRNIVLNIIKSKLGIYSNRIYARNCEIKIVPKKDKIEFCNNYHIQGDGRSQFDYGLYFNNELISLMSFGKRKITGGNPDIEIIRYCTKTDTIVVGGASKLLNHFIADNNCKTLKTYSDNSISTGDVYKKLGFKLLRETKWNYWYIDTNNRDKLLHRSNFMRHKLNTTLTEKEEMYNRGYRRYYDAGNKVFILKLK